MPKGYNGPTLYHRLAEQISSYAAEDLPDFVKDVNARLAGIDQPDDYVAPTTHKKRMDQSARGSHNPGPGKKPKGLRKPQ